MAIIVNTAFKRLSYERTPYHINQYKKAVGCIELFIQHYPTLNGGLIYIYNPNSQKWFEDHSFLNCIIHVSDTRQKELNNRRGTLLHREEIMRRVCINSILIIDYINEDIRSVIKMLAL